MRPSASVSRVVLLSIVAIVHFSTTTSSVAAQKQPQLLLRLLAEQPTGNLDDIPSRWGTVQNGAYRVPQMEIHLLKDQVSSDKNRHHMNEYKHFGPDHDTKTSLTINERKRLENIEKSRENESEDEDKDADDIVMPDRIIQPIGSRNIIHVPQFCPMGERQDSIGRCRPVLELATIVDCILEMFAHGDGHYNSTGNRHFAVLFKQRANSPRM